MGNENRAYKRALFSKWKISGGFASGAEVVSVMGKNYSRNNNEKRSPKDFYQTPYELTRALLDREFFTADVLEPCAGQGAIVDVLKEWDRDVTSFDISDTENGDNDFLWYGKQHENIITNPPFSLAMDFILKAKVIAKYKFAMLLPLSYLHGKERYSVIYKDTKFPLSTVFPFTRYITLSEEKTEFANKSGMIVYAWFVWDKIDRKRDPIIRWIDL
jgi:hypothetical protein